MSNRSKVTLAWFRSGCDPYRTLGRSTLMRVCMPLLSLLVETMPGTVTWGSVSGLPFGCGLGNANSTVINAPESIRSAVRLLIFVFTGGRPCFHLSSPDFWDEGWMFCEFCRDAH